MPVAVINNDYIRRLGTRAGPIARYMLRHRKMKYWMRSIYALTSLRRLKKIIAQLGRRQRLLAGRKERRRDPFGRTGRATSSASSRARALGQALSNARSAAPKRDIRTQPFRVAVVSMGWF